jgi:hypothetical protein
VHVFNTLQHLKSEEAASVLPHRASHLTQVEDEATLNVLHHDVDEALNNAAGWLYDLTIVAEF